MSRNYTVSIDEKARADAIRHRRELNDASLRAQLLANANETAERIRLDRRRRDRASWSIIALLGAALLAVETYIAFQGL